jgi:hypothetical protein
VPTRRGARSLAPAAAGFGCAEAMSVSTCARPQLTPAQLGRG